MRQNSLTLSEVARSRPPRGNGAPSRTRSHYDRILALLRDRGPIGVLSSELYDAPELYGRSPRNRVSEMRQDGCLIETVPAGASVVRYILIRDSEGAVPPRQTSSISDSQDWYTTQTGKSRAAVVQDTSTTATTMPLFEGVR